MTISRRCLICANLNPCRDHSEADQEAELARNDAAIALIHGRAASPFRDFTPALGWRWRSSNGALNAPTDMETRHLFFTLRMIWNNSQPEQARVGAVRLYCFGPQYTVPYMRQAILHIGRELFTRPDILPEWRSQLEQMAAWINGADWHEVDLIRGARPALTHEES